MNKGNVLTASLLFLLFLGVFPRAFAGDFIHISQPNDTLWDLCLKYTNKRGCWLELPKYNNVSNDRAIPVGYPIRIPSSWLIKPPTVGNVISVSGDVSYVQNASSEGTPLAAGQSLHLGGRVISGSGSAKLMLGTDNVVLLRPLSELVIDTMTGASSKRSVSELSLPKGEVEVNVKPNRKSRFLISTPAAIAAVRGTEYRVNASGEKGESMRSEVLTGAVDVASDTSSILVPAGFGVAAKKGEPVSEPRKLLDAPTFARDYSAVNSPVEIQWDNNPAAKAWLLDVLENDPSGTLLSSNSTSEPAYALGDVEEGCYQLRVRAVDNEGFNGNDASTLLCVVPRLAAVTQLSDITANESGGTLQMRWSAVSGAKHYRVEVAQDDSFTDITNTYQTADTTIEFSQGDMQALSARVIAIDAMGNESPAGPVASYEASKPFPWDVYLTGMLIFFLAL